MKKYIKFLVPSILLSTSIAFAQDSVNGDPVVRENSAAYEIVEMELENNSKIYQETKATYPVVFDESDRYKLNQDRIVVAPRLETTFKLDSDNDSTYEREITIKYVRPENFRYDFMLTENGLQVWSNNMKEIHRIDSYNNKKKVNMLSSEGIYNIISTNGEVYEIEVVDMK
ncbi:hypothetical protein [Kordia zhangzhouensis]|uniref:hypothetical protein n=1 Tax=Kordia zhangzhouensis TaxID=1620405 RepID=UPI000629BE77|nr:hypothetical protein [Kordia zhangzhouensis]